MAPPADGPRPSAVSVDIVVPVYDEEAIVERSVRRLHGYLSEQFPFAWRIVVADNGSTDMTRERAAALASELSEVVVMVIGEKGKGRAVRQAWTTSPADVVAFVDVDLSTGLTGLLPLVAPLVSGHSDLAIGSRLSEGSVVARGPKREITSRLYNLLLRVIFAVRFHDAQCGFKAMRTDVARLLLPAVEDEGWFFDTELLLLAEHNGLRIHEVPVDWVDDPDSRVDVRKTAIDDLRGVRRVLWSFMRGGGAVELGALERKPLVDDFGRQTVSFSLVGLASTIATLALFLLLRDGVGPLWANLVASAGTSVFNTWAHRRWTFRRRGAAGRWWHIAGAVAVFVLTLVVSSVGLALVGGNRGAELAVLFVTWGVAGIFRFTVLRSWVYRRTSADRG